MRARSLIVTGIVLAFVLSIAFAEEKAAPAKVPSQEEMMALMAKYGNPAPQHEVLKAMAGTFDTEVSMQMAPDAPPMTSKGKMKNEIILGGRFLKGDYTGDFAGQPFSGMQTMGYDLYKKKYISSWIDSMSTAMMTATGEADSSGKVITCTSTIDCPMTNGPKTMRQVTTIIDDNTHTYEVYDLGPDGKEFKSMTIKYTRAK